MFKNRQRKVCVTLTPTQKRLLVQGLLFFRSKVLAEGVDTIDIDRLLKKVIKNG